MHLLTFELQIVEQGVSGRQWHHGGGVVGRGEDGITWHLTKAAHNNQVYHIPENSQVIIRGTEYNNYFIGVFINIISRMRVSHSASRVTTLGGHCLFTRQHLHLLIISSSHIEL